MVRYMCYGRRPLHLYLRYELLLSNYVFQLGPTQQLIAHPQFEKQLIHVTFADKEWEFDFWGILLWKWATNMVEDPRIASLFAWDAVELSKFDGQEWKVFIHEPFTAQRMWDIQVCSTPL